MACVTHDQSIWRWASIPDKVKFDPKIIPLALGFRVFHFSRSHFAVTVGSLIQTSEEVWSAALFNGMSGTGSFSSFLSQPYSQMVSVATKVSTVENYLPPFLLHVHWIILEANQHNEEMYTEN